MHNNEADKAIKQEYEERIRSLEAEVDKLRRERNAAQDILDYACGAYRVPKNMPNGDQISGISTESLAPQ